MRFQRGVALVQVLLVTAIILLLVMQLSLLGREQVRRAQALLDRSEANLYLHSREVALLYTLLTEPLVPSAEGGNPYAAAWNFHGTPFEVDGLEFRLQDQSGLMRIPAHGFERYRKLLLSLGAGPNRARELAEALDQWQALGGRQAGRAGNAKMRGGVGGAVQYFGELQLVEGMDETLYRQLAELMTLYPATAFNPLTAPAALLAAELPASTVSAIERLRARGELDAAQLWRLSGVDTDDQTLMITGPGIGIEINGEYKGVVLRRHLVVGIQPHQQVPLTLWSRERFATGVPK